MKEFNYTITDPQGIHARPAGVLVKEAAKYQSTITLEKDGKTGDAKRIFAVMGLAAKCGNTLNVKVEGPDEDEAAKWLWKNFLRQICNIKNGVAKATPFQRVDKSVYTLAEVEKSVRILQK